MKKIIKIVGVEEHTKNNKRYTITFAILENGEEVSGWGSDFEVNDLVMDWWDEAHSKHKMKRGENEEGHRKHED